MVLQMQEDLSRWKDPIIRAMVRVSMQKFVVPLFNEGCNEEERDMKTDCKKCATDGDQDGSSPSDSSFKWLTDSLVAVNSNRDREKQPSIECRPSSDDLHKTCPWVIILKEDHWDLHAVDDTGHEINNGKCSKGNISSILDTLSYKDKYDCYVARNTKSSSQTTNCHADNFHCTTGKHFDR
eukprot:XP_011680373.1 PREDICTED: uncharacterized protein LOC105445921 [Strongylocentrotus purpuratus]